ncbi:MAG: metallophosphoesterase [Victivallaceae bacterium]|nr:metallophosphoesterase [Victivallaceae bacterium]
MKIIHFSDPHAGGAAEDWMAYIDKRWVGVFNYRFRRRFQHDLTLLEKAVTYILENRPDIAVCTGDLTSTGQPGEFEKTLTIMKPLLNSGIPLIYVPGNHDCYVRLRKCREAVENAVRELCDYEFNDLPLVKSFAGCDFIVVNESGPTNLFSSRGHMDKKTSDFVLDYCSQPKNRPRIIVGHYPLLEEHPLLRFRHDMGGHRQVAKLLCEKNIDISLCGHIHKPFAKIDNNGRGEYSAGSVTRNGTIAEIEFSSQNNIFKYRKINLV